MKKIILLLIIVMTISFILPNIFFVNEIRFATVNTLKEIGSTESLNDKKVKLVDKIKENIFNFNKQENNNDILKSRENKIENNDYEQIKNFDDIDANTNNIKVTINEVENIKVLLTKQNEVIELPFDEYIQGVLVGEMPVTYELEALKAQAIVARTYTMYKINNNLPNHKGADICDDINCCQCYKTKEYAFTSWDDLEENQKWEKIENAVLSTKGKYITYSGEIIPAYFHANSGGKTENIESVWGGDPIPYLTSVQGNEKDLYVDSKDFTASELIKKIPNYNGEDKLEIMTYTQSGRADEIRYGNNKIKATELRKLLELRSTNIKIEYLEDGKVKFNTIGYGHGVGMSQYGANQMALEGKTCEEIIKHYYTGTEIAIKN